MAFPTGFIRLGKITLLASKVSGGANLTNFPVLLKDANFSANMYLSMDNGGGDLRFSSDIAGTTQLACEVVSFDTVNSKAEVYVKIPTLSYTTNTIIYVWGGAGGTTQPSVTDTYGRNAVWTQYKAVYHFQSSGTDSTGYCDVTGTNSPTYAAGQLGNCAVLDGSTQGFENETANIMRPDVNSPFFWECWVKNLTGSYSTIWETGYEGTNPNMDGQYVCQAINALKVVSNTRNDAWISSTNAVTSNTWTHVVGAFNGSSTISFLKSGAANGTPAENSISSQLTTRGIHIGYYGGSGSNSYVNGNFFSGSMDELRISYNNLGVGWGTTQYNNQNGPTTFATTVDEMTTVAKATAGSASWVCPVGVTTLLVKLWAGGGAGGSVASAIGGGGGGAGGQFVKKTIAVTAGTSYSYVVAATKAGTAGANGGAGNDSTFNSTSVVAKGGAGGLSFANGGTGGAGSTANAVADLVIRGGNGGSSTGSTSSGGGGGGAGSATQGGDTTNNVAGIAGTKSGGAGGAGRTTTSAGNAGTGCGGAGGGALCTTVTSTTGGTGAIGRSELIFTTPTISALKDNFDDNSIDSKLWTSANTAETGGQLVVTTDATATYYGAVSVNYFDLTESNILVQLTDAGDQTIASRNTVFQLVKDASNSIAISVEGGAIMATKIVASTWAMVGSSQSYVPATHQWLRIRETAGTVYFDYSADGINWNNLASVAAPFVVSALQVELYAGCDAVSQTVDTSSFDNLNYPPTQQTITGKGKLVAVTTKTLTGLSRITISTLKTITGIAKINTQASTTKTITGLARVQVSTSRTLTGLSRITANAAKAVTGKAKVTVATLKTITGESKLTVATTKTITGLARVQVLSSKGIGGISRIQIITQQALQGVAKLTVSNVATLQGKARVTILTLKNISGISRVQEVSVKTIMGVAKVQNAVVSTAKTIQGLARITVSSIQSIVGSAKITVSNNSSIFGKSNILKVQFQFLQGRAKITAVNLKNISGKATLILRNTQDILGIAKIQKSATATILGRSRVQQIVAKTLHGISKVTAKTLQTITGKANLYIFGIQNIVGVSRVYVPTEKCISGKAKIRAAYGMSFIKSEPTTSTGDTNDALSGLTESGGTTGNSNGEPYYVS